MERFREQGVVDRDIFKKAGEQGFLMVWPEERYGGMDDYDIRWEQVIIEELAYARCSDWFGSLHSPARPAPGARALRPLPVHATPPKAATSRRSGGGSEDYPSYQVLLVENGKGPRHIQ